MVATLVPVLVGTLVLASLPKRKRVAIRNENDRLRWQSKAVLLLVLPWTAANVVLQAHWWFTQVPSVAWTTLGISAIFGLIVWKLRAGTAGAALTGALITASLMFSTTQYPYESSWLHGGLMPLLAVFLLTWGATKIGRTKKEQLGTAENKRGRNAAQVAANLGVAALVSFPVQAITPDKVVMNSISAVTAFAALAALAEAAADTVSSEIGQVLGGEPRLITTLRRVESGTDGGITVAGTITGAAAALLVAIIGFGATHGWRGLLGYWVSIGLCATGGIFGLLFDSLLGATLERKGWLNNDAVNFLSTVSAVLFPLAAIGVIVWRISPR
jgi:uncharacterized protein (TIGR00297 family)